jgi:hypothetical protein
MRSFWFFETIVLISKSEGNLFFILLHHLHKRYEKNFVFGIID